MEDEYVPDFPDALRMFEQAARDAAAVAKRVMEVEVQHLLRCNRVAHREIGNLEHELEAYRRNEPRDELIKQRNEMKVEVERLRVENATLTLRLAEAIEQRDVLAKVVNRETP